MAKSRDRWPELLKLVEEDDRLPVREAGSWTLDKLYFWHRYIEITTQALGKHPSWPQGLIYVDLFGGPGICLEKTSHLRAPGSALVASQAMKPFRRIIVCEQDAETADACRARLSRLSRATDFVVLQGDCNALVHDVVALIPTGALTLAFVDPTGLHTNFTTIHTLTGGRAVDLLILFPDSVDIVRNFEIYFETPDSNLDRVLGPAVNWRRDYSQLPRHDSLALREYFAEVYKRQLRISGTSISAIAWCRRIGQSTGLSLRRRAT